VLTGTRSSIYRGERGPGHRRDPLLGHVLDRPAGPWAIPRQPNGRPYCRRVLL